MQLKFTDPESFMLFYEGLRCVQIFRDENDPARLTEASTFLEEAIRTYPEDAPSHYYLGIVRAFQAQVEESDARREEAALIFERLGQQTELGNLRKRAKLAEDTMRNRAPTPDEATIGVGSRLRTLLSGATERVSVAARDATVTDLQTRVAALYARARQEVTSERRPAALPASSQTPSTLADEIEALRESIRKAAIPEPARIEMDADLLNTKGMLVETSEPSTAATLFRQALTLRPDWLPAKQRLANVLARQSGDVAVTREKSRLDNEIIAMKARWKGRDETIPGGSANL